MKVATWNLDQRNRNTAKWHRQLAEIQKIEADVWILTEAYRNFTPGNDYTHIACSAEAPDRDSPDGRWVVIWSRLRATQVKLGADSKRCAALRLDDGTMIIGTVLPWLGDSQQHEPGSEAFQARLNEQATEWKRLCTDSADRFCVAGDFNQDLLLTGHYYHSAASRQALRETLADCALTCLTGGASDPLTVVNNLASIDHICIGKGLLVTNPVAVWPEPGSLDKNLSDHYGVWVDVEIASA